jgi:hypothetical protein
MQVDSWSPMSTAVSHHSQLPNLQLQEWEGTTDNLNTENIPFCTSYQKLKVKKMCIILFEHLYL